MTTEDDFHAHLDANPEDHHARMVFADYLDEQGDPRAAGYRALGKLRKLPFPEGKNQPAESLGMTKEDYTYRSYTSDSNPGSEPRYEDSKLPHDWVSIMYPNLGERDEQGIPSSWWVNHPTRRDAEDAAAHAFTKLPPERQAELLADPVQMKRRVRYARKRRELQSTNKRNN